MDTSTTENANVGGNDGGETVGDEVVTISRKDYEVMNQTLGSLKRKIKDLEPRETPEKTPQSNEPDYAKLAFLNSTGVNHPDDQRVVMEEAARLKLSLNDVLNMEHIKGKLATQNDARLAEAGMPTSSGRKGGAGRGTVEYYLAHPNEVPPDLDLHNQVIDARMKQETDANKFSPEMFVG
jgi:hypothetical protein